MGAGTLTVSLSAPAFVGAPVVVVPRFDVESALSTIEREHVTVLACVSTQFIMMLSSPTLAQRDLSTLRVMFTGGEAVPHAAAARFEDMTGATIDHVAAEIPLVTKAVIDGPVRNQDQRGLWVLGLAAIGIGLTEAVLWFLRRWLIARSYVDVTERSAHVPSTETMMMTTVSTKNTTTAWCPSAVRP